MDNPLTGAKVMIVDDIPQNLQLLRSLLERESVKVFAFRRGDHALAAAERNPPDLVLLDIKMPFMDGYSVCQRFKEHPKLAETPVLFMSALNQTEDIVKGFQTGAVDYLTKPVRMEEVKVRLATHLKLRKKQREVQSLLNDTLIGGLRSMTEMLALLCPDYWISALKIRQHIKHMVASLALADAWQYQIAAMLSGLGVVSSGMSWKDPRVESAQDAFDVFVELFEQDGTRIDMTSAANVVRGIPRLDEVAGMLEEQMRSASPDSDWRNWTDAVRGGQMLKVATALEWLVAQGVSIPASLDFLESHSDRFYPKFVEELRRVVLSHQEDTVRCISIGDLMPGLVLTRDVTTHGGVKLVPAGTEITLNLLHLIKNRSRRDAIAEPLYVHTLDAKELFARRPASEISLAADPVTEQPELATAAT